MMQTQPCVYPSLALDEHDNVWCDGFVTNVDAEHDIAVVQYTVPRMTPQAYVVLMASHDVPLKGTVFADSLADTPEGFRHNMPMRCGAIASPYECILARMAFMALHPWRGSAQDRAMFVMSLHTLNAEDRQIVYSYGFMGQAIGDAIIQNIARMHKSAAYNITDLVLPNDDPHSAHIPQALKSILVKLSALGSGYFGTIFHVATYCAFSPYSARTPAHHMKVLAFARDIMRTIAQTDTAYDPTTLCFVMAFNALLALAAEGPSFVINELPSRIKQRVYREYVLEVNEQCAIIATVAAAHRTTL